MTVGLDVGMEVGQVVGLTDGAEVGRHVRIEPRRRGAHVGLAEGLILGRPDG